MNFLTSLRPSGIFLITANLVPLIGVLFWDWRVFDVMLLFWLENVIIGIFNILKMSAWIIRTGRSLAFIAIVFFAVHYGIFAFGHFVILMGLFGDVQPGDKTDLALILSRPEFHTIGFYGAALGLFASHLFSFCANFLGRREIAKTNMHILMIAPYKRVMILHVTLIVGGAAAQILKQPAWAMVLLIGLKIAFDLRAHRKSHLENDAVLAKTLKKPSK
ncbi:MAG TPA: DUF6498-containing protein [Alphaproteobacteria bacterium]|nr:DUF6498-containing protein [Alphaproteobacteria bacterium]